MSYAEIKTDIEVVLLSHNYENEKTLDGNQNGTRVYMEASYHPKPGNDIVYLPDTGDSWSLDYPELKVKTSNQTYVGDSTNCGRIWTLTYGSVPVTYSAGGDEAEYQTNIELGAEAVTFEPKGEIWKWYYAGSEVYITAPLFFIVSTMTIKLYRTIFNGSLDSFMSRSLYCVGKCNGDVFYKIPDYMLLYEGANLQEGRGDLGQRIWKAELSFKWRSVTGFWEWNTKSSEEGGTDGWNWIMQDNTKGRTDKYTPWSKPYFDDPITAGHKFLYGSVATKTLKELLTVGGPDTGFPDLGWMK